MYKQIIRSCVICLALTLFGCGSPKLSELKKGDVILAFGDSLTVGVGTEEKYSYPRVLEQLSGIEVVSSGVSGETTDEGLNRLVDVIEESSGDLLILLEGGNDILRNKSYATIESNLDKMIVMAQERGVEVVLIGVPEKSLFSDSAPFYRRLATKHDLVFDSSLISSLLRSPSMKSDSIHFNKEGYEQLAEGIYDVLSDNGAF